MRKSVNKNFLYNLTYQIFILIIPLITTPYLSRILEPNGVGIYGYIYSIVTYFVLFGSLGVAMYGQREIAYVQSNVEKRSKVFFEILLFRFITIAISILTYLIVFGRSGDNVLYFRIFTLEIFAASIDISWFFQGIEDFKKTVYRNIIVKLLSLILIFLFVKSKSDLYIYILIYVFSNVIGNFSLWLYLPKYIKKVNFRSLNIKMHIRPILIMFIPQIAIQIYTVLDRTMIGVILNDMSEVGFYEQTQKIVRIALAIVGAYGTVMCPRYANAASNKQFDKINEYLDKSFQFVLFMGIAIMFGIIGISDNFVIWFLGDGYDKVKILLKISSFLAIIIGLSNVCGMQYLVQLKKNKEFLISVSLGAITNFILNIFFIKAFKSTGATIASVIAEIVVLAYQLMYLKRHSSYKIKNIFTFSFNYMISGIVMLILVLIVGMYLPSNIIGTSIQIFIGAIIYYIVLLLLKDKFIINNSKKIINKIEILMSKNKRSD